MECARQVRFREENAVAVDGPGDRQADLFMPSFEFKPIEG